MDRRGDPARNIQVSDRQQQRRESVQRPQSEQHAEFPERNAQVRPPEQQIGSDHRGRQRKAVKHHRIDPHAAADHRKCEQRNHPERRRRDHRQQNAFELFHTNHPIDLTGRKSP